MSTTAKTKAAALALVQGLVAGTEKHFPKGSLTFGNQSVTVASLVGQLQSLIDAMQARDAAQQGAKDAMSALRTSESNVGPVLRAYVKFLRATYGNASTVLADFGLQPEKARTPLTSTQQAAKTAKLQATRKLRGTLGPKQKAAIKASPEAPLPGPSNKA